MPSSSSQIATSSDAQKLSGDLMYRRNFIGGGNFERLIAHWVNNADFPFRNAQFLLTF
jgi:hypothetical protein